MSQTRFDCPIGNNRFISKPAILFFVVIAFSSFHPLFAESNVDLEINRLPDEYEASYGHGNAMNGGGSAALSDVSSVKLNPALLIMEKKYKLQGGYSSPSSGRDFYNAGIVDGTTSKDVAAGVSYVSFSDEYEKDFERRLTSGDFADSPVERRISGGFAKSTEAVSLGLTVNFVEGYQYNPELGINDLDEIYAPVSGFTFGLGMAGLIMPNLRYGLSVDNLSNRKLQDLAPRTYRGGLAYLMMEGNLSLHLDYVQRERVYFEEDITTDDEKMVIFSGTTRVYDIIRLIAGYGAEWPNPSAYQRSTLSYGLSVDNENFSLSYSIRRPYLELSESTQSIQLSVAVQM